MSGVEVNSKGPAPGEGMPQADAESTPSTAPAPKRLRVSRACEQCRSRKAKCDGGVPTCSTCVSLGQVCSYGNPPRKRGLAAGSFAMLERTVKLYEKIFGVLFINVPGSEQVTAALVKRHNKTLFDDGAEGEKLTKSWKESAAIKMLEAIQSAGTENAEQETGQNEDLSASLSPNLDLAQQLFQDALQTMTFGLQPGHDRSGENEYALRDFGLDSEMDWLGGVSNQPQASVEEYGHSRKASHNSARLEDAHGAVQVRPSTERDSRALMPSPLVVDPLLMGAGISNDGDSIGLVDSTNARNRGDHNADSLRVSQQSPAVSPPPLFPSFPNQHLLPRPSAYQIQEATDVPGVNVKSTYEIELPFDTPSPEGIPNLELPKSSKLLLDLYFTYTHVWLPILDKYEMIRLYHSLNPSQKTVPAKSGVMKLHKSQKQQEVPPVKRALLYAVLALASLQHDGLASSGLMSGKDTNEWRSSQGLAPITSELYLASQSIIFSASAENSLEHVQALLLLSLFNLSQNQVSTAWSLIGHAGRSAVDIGLHLDNAEPKAKSRFATRTWLGYIVLEVFICNKLNREPAYLEDVDWETAIVEEDGWEEWDSWKDMPAASLSNDGEEFQDEGNPSHILGIFNQLVALSHIIKSTSTSALSKSETANDATSTAYQTTISGSFERLQSWARDLPPYCAIDLAQIDPETALPSVTLPHVTNLHMLHMDHMFSLASAECILPDLPDMSTTSATLVIATLMKSFKSVRSLAIAPCTFLHFLNRIVSLDIPSEGLDAPRFADHEEAKALHDELSRLWILGSLLEGNSIIRRPKVTQRQPPMRQTLTTRSLYPSNQFNSPGSVPTRPRRSTGSSYQSTTLHNQGYSDVPLNLSSMSPSNLFTTPPSFSTGMNDTTLYQNQQDTMAGSMSSITMSVPSPSALFNLPSSRSGHQRSASLMTAPEERNISAGGSIAPQGSSATSLSQAQTAPSPDTFDEEMGMLECLPWAQDLVPEFMQNLGYIGEIGGFPVPNFQFNGRQGAVQPGFDFGNQNAQEHLLPFESQSHTGDNRDFDTAVEDQMQSISRPTLNPVLEQWLGDMLVAGNGRS